jgi:hypothetical protein
VGDDCDNCPSASNVDQVDADSDLVGDSCDLCPNDTGADYLYDPDSNGTVDSCEPCGPGLFYEYDTDSDGVNDSCVNPNTIEEKSSMNFDATGDNIFSCSLNVGGKSGQKGLAIILVLPFFIVALWRRKSVEKIH